MPQHDIEVTIPAHPVVNADLKVIVQSDGQRLGELRISKGSIDWRPAKHRDIRPMRWETFARLMERWQDGDLS